MTTAAIRTKLHEYIETCDDSKAKALYTLLQPATEKEYTYTESEMNMLHERAERYLQGKVEAIPADEAIKRTRAQRKSK